MDFCNSIPTFFGQENIYRLGRLLYFGILLLKYCLASSGNVLHRNITSGKVLFSLDFTFHTYIRVLHQEPKCVRAKFWKLITTASWTMKDVSERKGSKPAFSKIPQVQSSNETLKPICWELMSFCIKLEKNHENPILDDFPDPKTWCKLDFVTGRGRVDPEHLHYLQSRWLLRWGSMSSTHLYPSMAASHSHEFNPFVHLSVRDYIISSKAIVVALGTRPIVDLQQTQTPQFYYSCQNVCDPTCYTPSKILRVWLRFKQKWRYLQKRTGAECW